MRPPSCSRDLTFKLAGQVHMPGDVWADKHADRPIIVQADSRTGLWTAALAQLMRVLGWRDPEMLAGLLIDFLNHFPLEVRRNLAFGIQEGFGLVIKRDGEKVLVDLAQLYDAFGKEEEEVRTPGGLILPGK